MCSIKHGQHAVSAAVAMSLLTISTARAAQEMHYEVGAGSFQGVSEFHEQEKTNLIVNSLPSSTGLLRFDYPWQVSWTGTTTVGYGTLWLTSLGGEIHTADQGSWTVGPAATLRGAGEIGLAPGERVTVAGQIGMSGDNDPRRFTIDSDLVMQSGSTMFIWGGAFEALDRFDVSGALDLSSTGDTLTLQIAPSPPFPFPPLRPSNVIASYGSRLGEFDNITGLYPGWSVTYTSPANAGPGQILLLTPEPVALAPLAAMLVVLRPRRGRR